MSNSKRISNRIKKLNNRRYVKSLYVTLSIDVKPFIEGISKVKESIDKVIESMQNLKVKYGR